MRSDPEFEKHLRPPGQQDKPELYATLPIVTVGLVQVLSRNQWGLTIAGVSVRYRRRIRAFHNFEMQSRAIGWDDRLLYLDQSRWTRGGDCANHAIYRAAVTSAEGIVSAQKVMQNLGFAQNSPKFPNWVQAWIEAEAKRPWPPIRS